MPIFATSSEGGPGVRASLSEFALVTGMVLIIALCPASANAKPLEMPTDVQATSASAAVPPLSEVNGPAATIEMRDDMPMYQPDHIIIRAGETVEWVNKGDVSHSVVDDPGKADKPQDSLLPVGSQTFASGNVMPGGKFRHTFLTPGRYRYFCMSHEIDSMVGEIIVKPSAPQQPARVASQSPAQR